MKKLIAVLLAMVLCVVLVGCHYATVDEETKEETLSSMFVLIERSGLWEVVYHKDTKVMYVVSVGGYNGGNFTVMVNPDGTPQLWDGK